MSNYPSISIVTPNLNQVRFIEETIDSVLSQGYPNLEYIIIDGGSTDGSLDIIKKYERHLKYWVSEPDKGLYHAVQKGFAQSQGEIMAWINSDDRYHRNAFFTVAELFGEHPQVEWLMGTPSLIDEKGRIVQVDIFKRWSKYMLYMGDFRWLQQESMFWRRSLWQEAGSTLNLSKKYAADFELWLRYFRYKPLYLCRAPLGCFRARQSGSVSVQHYESYISELTQMLAEEPLTPAQEQDIKRIKFYQWVEQIPVLRRFLKSEGRLRKLYGFPPYFIFHQASQKFGFIN